MYFYVPVIFKACAFQKYDLTVIFADAYQANVW